MAVKLFNRIGLRRDFNLSDLINAEAALNNILRTDTMSEGDSFTVEDIAPIKNIYITDITADTFLTLDGIMVEFTQILVDESTGLAAVDNEDNPIPYRPFVKIKNRLDTAYFTTGEPFFFGGDGPTATYYDARNIIRQPNALTLGAVYQIGDVVLSSNNIYRVIQSNSSTSTVLSHTTGSQDGFLFERAYDAKEVFFNGTYDVITGEERTESDNFWERGFFLYGDKIRDSYLSTLGGVKWNGYFKPTQSGSHRFYIRSSGNVQFKFQDPGVLSSVETKYGQPNTSYVNNYIANNPGLTTNQQTWINSFYNILTDNTRKFVEVRLEVALSLATDDIVYIDSLQGQLVPKQYRIFTLRPSGEQWSVDRLWIEVTADFNRKNVAISDLPSFGTDVWANANGNRSYVRYYPYERRELKTYLNSIYKNLELPSGNFTTTATTITFTGTNADLYYYQFMINDYIYDYRQRGTETQGVRRFVVTGLNDSTKTVTVSIDTSYNGIGTASNNDQQARYDGQDLYVFTEDYGGSPPFGDLIQTTYTSGALNDTISGTTKTSNLHFVARFGEEGDNLREKYITINQFIPKYEEHAFEMSFFMKDEDVPFTQAVEEKGIIIWYADENSGYDPVSYKHFYDPEYEFYQIGDFKTFLDNTIGFGGTSRETGIDQRAFGKPQLLEAGDQYQTFYSTLPVQSVYTPEAKWNDIVTLTSSAVTAGSRKISIDNVVEIEVGNYVIPYDITAFYSDTLLSSGTRVVEVIADQAGGSGDAIISKIVAQTSSNTQFAFFNHRGFVTPLYVPAKGYGPAQAGGGTATSNRIFFDPDLPVGSCTFNDGEFTFDYWNGSLFSSIYSISNTSGQPQGFSGSTNWNTSTLNFNSNAPAGVLNTTISWVKNTANTITFTGPGMGYVWAFRAQDMSEVQQGMVFVSNKDSSTQTTYRRVTGYVSPTNNTLNNSVIFFSQPYTDVTSGDMLGAIYYDRGIDIVKPLESYCNGTACSQNAYQTEVVTNNDGESQIVTSTKTTFIAPLLHETDQPTLDSTTSQWSGTDTITGSGNGMNVTYWRDAWARVINPTQLYKDDVVHVSLRSVDSITSTLTELGYPNTGALTGTNDFIPIGRYKGHVKIQSGSNYRYYAIIEVADDAVSWVDTDQDSNGNTINKKIDWTKFNTSDFWIERWSFKDGSNRITQQSVATSSNTLTTRLNNWTSGSSTTSSHYLYTGGSFSLTNALADQYFHNPQSMESTAGGTGRTIANGSWVREEVIDGVRKSIYFENGNQFQGPYSLYGKHYTGTNPTNGMNVTNTYTSDSQKIQPIINMEDKKFSDARRISTNFGDDPFDYVQFRSQIYQLVPGNSESEGLYPFVRFVNPFSSVANTQQYIQNSMNALTVYTFANTTTNRELCCPPLDTSPPFDSSAIGLSTTLNEPDMSVAGGLNVRIVSARHPVADIYTIPASITTSDLEVQKKLRIDFRGSKYDLLIGDTIPQAVIDAN